jgi:hypothetical protein
MSLGGGGGGQTQTTQIDRRFDPLIDYATQAAKGVQESGYTPYTGDRFAELSAPQTSGIEMITQRAMAGDPTMRQATATLQDTLAGGNTNPYLDQLVQRAQQSVRGSGIGADVNSGSFGNSGIQEVTERNLGDIATQMYGNAYNTDRANQMAALNLAPTYGQQSYQDAAQLMRAGQTLQDQEQQAKDFGYQQFQEEQNLPYKQMGAYQGLLGSSGVNSTTTQSGGGK